MPKSVAGRCSDEGVAQPPQAQAGLRKPNAECSEARIHDVYGRALASPDRPTALTNLFTGRPARGIVNRLMSEMGPLSDSAPAYPTAAFALQPLRNAAEAAGRDDFSPLWAGQGFPLAMQMSAAALTRSLMGG